MVCPQKVDAQDYKSLHTKTWSVYGQGGVSWATNMGLKGINSSNSTFVAPEIGIGVNYNIRPWVRLGANYEFSKFKKEHSFDDFQAMDPILDLTSSGMTQLLQNKGGIAYGKQWMRAHNVDLTAEFNIMQIWQNRKSTWFNLYAGTGVGAMFAKNNIYSVGMGYEEWADPNSTLGGNLASDNWASYSWVKTDNDSHRFSSLYIPVVLSAEFDVLPQLALGVKGEYKVVLSSDDFAPNGIVTTALTVRYNFVGVKQGLSSNKQKYEKALANYNASMEQCNLLRKQYEVEKNKNRQLENDCQKSLDVLNIENDDLKKQLKDCESRSNTSELTILFDANVSKVSKADRIRLSELSKQLKANEIINVGLIGEASADGAIATNQKLSEKRLANVISILKKNGIDGTRIKSANAIGDTNKVYDASRRRVSITISK